MATPKQSRSLIVISNSVCNNDKSHHRQPKHDVFIGNLKYDVSSRALISNIQNLFSTVQVCVPDFRFMIFQQKSKNKPPRKYAFVTLSNKTEEELVYQFDNKEDLNFVCEGLKLQVQKRVNFKQKQSKHLRLLLNDNINKLKRSQSSPGINKKDNNFNQLDNNSVYRKELYIGQYLQAEDRVTEYKRGSGKYMKNMLIPHIRKYICAFLNSQGGRLMIGVDDKCKVYGVSCNRKQEDQARCLIDNIIKKFQPHVAPHLYIIDFIPVKISPFDQIELDSIDPLLKVVEVSVKRPNVINSLYVNDKNEIFIRRDGSVEGPLKTAQIVEWCRLIFSSNSDCVATFNEENIILAKESYSNCINLERIEETIKSCFAKLEIQLNLQQELQEKQSNVLLREVKKWNCRNECSRKEISLNTRSTKMLCCIL